MISNPLLEEKIKAGSLTIEEASILCKNILKLNYSEEEIRKILILMYEFGETSACLIGFSKAMKELTSFMKVQQNSLLDVCGTGGDGLNTFNISTLTALVTSALGIPTAKHGNRSVTGKCGSFDLIDGLEISYQLSSKEMQERLIKHHLLLIFAPEAHPLMKTIMPIRKSIPHATIFNLVGPLANPQNLDYQVIGVYKSALLEPMAEAMQALGIKNGFVIHGYGGLDELSLEGPNTIFHVRPNRIVKKVIHPREYELKSYKNSDLAIRDKSHALEVANLVIHAKESSAFTESIIFNAALALYTSNYKTDLALCIKEVRKLLLSDRLSQHIKQLRRVHHVS